MAVVVLGATTAKYMLLPPRTAATPLMKNSWRLGVSGGTSSTSMMAEATMMSSSEGASLRTRRE